VILNKNKKYDIKIQTNFFIMQKNPPSHTDAKSQFLSQKFNFDEMEFEFSHQKWDY